ncbi:MAG: hypothetical protein ACR2PL_18280, partial [Dehalococcoidia bacterium]
PCCTTGCRPPSSRAAGTSSVKLPHEPAAPMVLTVKTCLAADIEGGESESEAVLTAALSDGRARDVLAYLGVQAGPPDRVLLERLVCAYVCAALLESARRIARRAVVKGDGSCPRWPEQFWSSALSHGFGGTCFESTYAFFSLLRALGYDGYLTVNDMHT